MNGLVLFAIFLLNINMIQGDCPDMWTQYGGSCYFLFEDAQTWSEANAICGNYKAHLVTINSAAENHFVENWVRNNQVHRQNVWIGANDIMTEGDFVWVENNKPVTFTDWTHGQPGHNNRKENCAELRADFGFHWNDLGCGSRSHYMCERSPDASVIG